MKFLLWLDRQRWIDYLFYVVPACDYKWFIEKYDDDVYLGRLDRFTSVISIIAAVNIFVLMFVLGFSPIKYHDGKYYFEGIVYKGYLSSKFSVLVVLVLAVWKSIYEFRKYGRPKKSSWGALYESRKHHRKEKKDD